MDKLLEVFRSINTVCDHGLMGTYSKLYLLKTGETRFATQFIMLNILENCKESLIKCYIDPTLADSVSQKHIVIRSCLIFLKI